MFDKNVYKMTVVCCNYAVASYPPGNRRRAFHWRKYRRSAGDSCIANEPPENAQWNAPIFNCLWERVAYYLKWNFRLNILFCWRFEDGGCLCCVVQLSSVICVIRKTSQQYNCTRKQIYECPRNVCEFDGYTKRLHLHTMMRKLCMSVL